MALSPTSAKEKRQKVFVLPDGTPMRMHDKSMQKMDEALLRYVYGFEQADDIRAYVKKKSDNSVGDAPQMRKVKHAAVTRYDPDEPWNQTLRPGYDSPLCQQCALCNADTPPATPFFKPVGPASPLVTIITDGITVEEDKKGVLGAAGTMSALKRMLLIMAEEGEVDINSIRWVPITRCAARGKAANIKIKGNWCRYHVIDDLLKHPPKLIITVGTQVTGLFSHKSNVQDWAGRVLTYRGWPDDWLTNRFYALPRPHPADPTGARKITGHPLFGEVPNTRIPLVPIQSPHMVFWDQNVITLQRFIEHVKRAVRTAQEGWTAPNYTRPWYRFTEDVDEVEAGLREILRHPGLLLAFDTETTGLRGWAQDAAIVSMMFRWADPETNEPRSLGFPFDFPSDMNGVPNAIYPHVKRLWPLIWNVLSHATLIGHNLTFDVLYTFSHYCRGMLGKFGDAKLNRLRDKALCALVGAAKYDTWHEAYVYRQQRERLGLEHMAYRFVPDMAGYEEDMTLLISLRPDELDPSTRDKGSEGHYLRCARDKWDSHLVPYVMGDAEVTYRAHEEIQQRLAKADIYSIPLAKPGMPGKFRLFTTPGRGFVYDKIMSPSAQVLTKIMARGMFVDVAKRKTVSEELNRKIAQTAKQFLESCKEFVDEQQLVEALREKSEIKSLMQLDLDSKTQLHTLFFNEHCLDLPVYRLTKKGRKIFGETREEWYDKLRAIIVDKNPRIGQKELAREIHRKLVPFAAIDKFTLNQLAVKHDHVRSLLEYRKLFKLNTAYVHPLLPDELREKGRPGHLMFDQCVHASFLLTGTRGGRLSCRDPNLQQLPRDGVVKELYTSRFGKRGCLYQADLSQIELRLMAVACGDPTMVKAYFDDTDLHSLTASRIFDIPYDHFTKEHMKWLQSKGKEDEAKKLDLNRTTAKTVNFLTGYGGGAFGLQNVLAMKGIFKEIEECQEIIELFFNSYPSLRSLLQYYKRFILDNLCAVSIFGRVRFFEEARSEDGEQQSKALRAGCNHLIQSTASDMMLIALFVIEDLMREADLESLLVSTVHDSLVIDAITEELPQIHEIVDMVLNNFPSVLRQVLGDDYDTSWMLVPFAGDSEVGHDYFHMKKIPKKNIDWHELLA